MSKAKNITSNIKTTYSIMSLSLLAIFALVILLIPVKTEAMSGGVNYTYRSPVNTGINNNYNNPNPVYYNQYPIYQPPAPAYYPTSTQTSYVTPTIDSTDKVATTTSTTKRKTATTTNTDKEEGKYEDLAANVIFGEIGFLPSGLFQWILFAILILLVVILTRRIFGGNKKYQEAPHKKA